MVQRFAGVFAAAVDVLPHLVHLHLLVLEECGCKAAVHPRPEVRRGAHGRFILEAHAAMLERPCATGRELSGLPEVPLHGLLHGVDLRRALVVGAGQHERHQHADGHRQMHAGPHLLEVVLDAVHEQLDGGAHVVLLLVADLGEETVAGLLRLLRHHVLEVVGLVARRVHVREHELVEVHPGVGALVDLLQEILEDRRFARHVDLVQHLRDIIGAHKVANLVLVRPLLEHLVAERLLLPGDLEVFADVGVIDVGRIRWRSAGQTLRHRHSVH
mmetsp:Transcript_63985/g.187726  ORF Transcript_63985/g.187726 Transcript_63985/m.187726 type:complete len:272 (+) Transcript_63985:2441-3256(+)